MQKMGSGSVGSAWLVRVVTVVAVFGALSSAGTAHAQQAGAPPPPVWRIPSPRADAKNPTEASPASVARGKGIFLQNCAMCHGNTGNGDGPAAPALTPKPAHLSRPEMWQQPDGELFWKIAEGRAPMPPFGAIITDTQRWDVVNFLRTLSVRPEGVVPMAVPAPAGAPPVAPLVPTGFVSRAEHDALKAEMEALKARLAAIEHPGAPVTPSPTPTPTTPTPPATAVVPPAPGTTPTPAPGTGVATQPNPPSQFTRDLTALNEAIRPSDGHFLVTGDLGVNFTAQKGSNSTFSAGFSPLFLWQVNDRILVEAGLDFSIDNDPNGENASTSTELSLANLSYIVNDHLIVGGGLFVVPFGLFHSRLDPRWINKLPDEPLPYGDAGIAPNGAVGFFASGGWALGTSKINYAFYVSNGPTLITDNPDAAGSLSFDNFNDPNNNKAVGGRVGYLPIPELEFGYSFQVAQVDPNGFEKTDALVQAIDVSYKREFAEIDGTIDVRSEFIWSHVDRATYQTFDGDGNTTFGPSSFTNNRNGGYVQAAYRPTMIHDSFIGNLEGIVRYDWLATPSQSPGGGRDSRVTLGIDYWIAPQTVFKVAYEIDHNKTGPSANAFMLEFSTGF